MASLQIVVLTEMIDTNTVEEILVQLIQLEEERFIAGFQQNVEKQWQKAWHDRHVRTKQFKVGGLVLMYDSKLFKHPSNIKTHWLGPYVIVHITKASVVKLHKLDGTSVVGMINKIRLKPYHDDCDMVP